MKSFAIAMILIFHSGIRGMCADWSVKARYRLVSRNCKRKTRVSIARWNLKEVRSKLPA